MRSLSRSRLPQRIQALDELGTLGVATLGSSAVATPSRQSCFGCGIALTIAVCRVVNVLVPCDVALAPVVEYDAPAAVVIVTPEPALECTTAPVPPVYAAPATVVERVAPVPAVSFSAVEVRLGSRLRAGKHQSSHHGRSEDSTALHSASGTCSSGGECCTYASCGGASE